MRNTTRRAPRRESTEGHRGPGRGAARTVVTTFGVLAGLAGIEHGVGEISQGSVRPEGLLIESWPEADVMEVLSGEPALTIIPNLLVSGVLTVVVSVALGIWSAGFAGSRRGGPVLVLLSAILLLVGGGFGPPLIGLILGIGAARIGAVPRSRPGSLRRALAGRWRWISVAAVLAYAALLPGVVILSGAGWESPELVGVLSILSFVTLIMAIVAALTQDRLPDR